MFIYKSDDIFYSQISALKKKKNQRNEKKI